MFQICKFVNTMQKKSDKKILYILFFILKHHVTYNKAVSFTHGLQKHKFYEQKWENKNINLNSNFLLNIKIATTIIYIVAYQKFWITINYQFTENEYAFKTLLLWEREREWNKRETEVTPFQFWQKSMVACRFPLGQKISLLLCYKFCVCMYVCVNCETHKNLRKKKNYNKNRKSDLSPGKIIKIVIVEQFVTLMNFYKHFSLIYFFFLPIFLFLSISRTTDCVCVCAFVWIFFIVKIFGA